MVDSIHVHRSSAIAEATARVAKRRGVPLVFEVRFDLAAAVNSGIFHQRLTWLEPCLRRDIDSRLCNFQAIVAAGQ